MNGIWIRSKDKTELIKANYIFVTNGWIYAGTNTENILPVGTYPSIERAKDLLDGIQEAIRDERIIYEMPEK